MRNPNTCPAGRRALRIPRSRRGWGRTVLLGFAMLACTFAGAGQAQSLDEAVDEIAEILKLRGDLEGQEVLVRPGYFFEMGSERNLLLSEYLAWQFTEKLARHGVKPISRSEDENKAIALQGRWNIESGQLVLSVTAQQAVGARLNTGTSRASVERRVPVANIDRKYLEPDLKSHGRYVVRQLEKGIAVNTSGSGRYHLHMRPFSAPDVADPERFHHYLRGQWRPAFTGSRRFRLVGRDGSNGELHNNVFVVGERIEVILYILDGQGQEVAATTVEMDKGLFPPGVLVSGVDAELAQCAGHVEAGRVSEAVKCYAGVLKEVNVKALEGVEGLKGETFRDCDGCPELVVVRSGSFMMGSPSSESGRDDDEGPEHRVTIGRPFAVGVKEVTRGEYGRFVSATGHASGDSCITYEGGEWEERSGRSWRNPGFGQEDSHPVVCVNWNDAKAYVDWLSRETGEAYRLLSESEWEYVARGGTETARYWGESERGQCRYANGADEASGNLGWGKASCNDGRARTSPVGSYEANGFGLRDVLGNVWEWVEDCWNGSYAGAPSDGSAWKSGDCSRRVLRGGSWVDVPRSLRSANRNRYSTGSRGSYSGFRIARTLTS